MVEFSHEETRRRAQDRYVLAKALIFRPQSIDFDVLDRGDTIAGAIVDIGLQHPSTHGFVTDFDLTDYGR